MTRAALALPLLLLVAACGGGGEDDAKAAYVTAAEAICKEADAAQKAEKTPSSPDTIPAYVRALVTLATDASAELNALEPPEEDAAELEEKFLAPLREQVTAGQAYAKQVEEAGAKKDTAGVLKLLGSAPTQVKVDVEFVRGYGLPSCAEAADTTS